MYRGMLIKASQSRRTLEIVRNVLVTGLATFREKWLTVSHFSRKVANFHDNNYNARIGGSKAANLANIAWLKVT